MPALVIEYVMEGHQRGYNFTSPTKGFNDEDLKSIWRQAMPRGQGWSQYVGARSLKTFLLGRAVVICETEVTDQRDENGRGGIRRTKIDLFSQADYLVYLEYRLKTLPPALRAQVERLPTFGQRLAITNKAMPKPRQNSQLVFLADYSGPEQWLLVEGLLLKLVCSPIGPLRRWGPIIPFTTLALSHHDELPLVAVPSAKAAALDKKTPVISL